MPPNRKCSPRYRNRKQDMTTQPRKIIVDCDPGVDDALALMLATTAPDAVQILGITTVAGNVPLEKTTRNAQWVMQMLGRPDIPVHAGCSRPIMHRTGRTASVHGTEGLGSIQPEDVAPAAPDVHAVDFLIETVRRHPGAITLCCLGPMTNIALAMLKAPDMAQQLEQIVFMGGAACVPGNITPAAEFNFHVDPHAAHVVLSTGRNLTMFGLDVTRRMTVPAGRMEAMRRHATDPARMMVRMLDDYAHGDPALHDPCVIAHLLRPDLFSGVAGHVQVDCTSALDYGRSVAALSERHRDGRDPNCRIMMQGDRDGLVDLLAHALTRLAGGNTGH
ncbi:cysteine hydrolase [Komagataeibacter rhaeticus AF1]|nr:cysteine hydrolase [Komagataeibacter rhaeticus AF1]